jgi:hypothetical protein
LAAGARSFNVVGHYSFDAGTCRVSALALMVTASKGDCAGPMGSGFITASVATTLIIVLRGTIPDFWSIIVGNALLAAAYGILWCGARKLDGNNVSILLALMGVIIWLIACSIGPIYSRPEARATVMAAIGVAYTLLVVFELWRTWRPGVALADHGAAASPCHRHSNPHSACWGMDPS